MEATRLLINGYVSNYGPYSDPDHTGYAYDFFTTSRDGNVIYDYPTYALEHCLANNGGYAFSAHVPDSVPNPPTFYADYCAATNNHTVFNFVDPYYQITSYIRYPGFYNNTFDSCDWRTFDYPVYIYSNPIVRKSGDYRIFLDPNSGLVNAGDISISNSGWSTRSDGKPDDGLGDIWPSYQTKIWSGLRADLNNDGLVDINDIFLLVGSWLVTEDGKKADIDRSEFVDIEDLYVLLNHWLMENSNINNLAGEPIFNFKDFAALAKFWRKEAIYPVNINSDGICNLTDFSILASEWLMEDMNVGIINLDNPDSFNYLEGQTVSGNIGISIFNPPPSIVQFTVYVDNILTGTHSAVVSTSES